MRNKSLRSMAEAAVLLVLIITVGSIVRHKRAVRPAGKHGK